MGEDGACFGGNENHYWIIIKSAIVAHFEVKLTCNIAILGNAKWF
jgi:hypothetical protein